MTQCTGRACPDAIVTPTRAEAGVAGNKLNKLQPSRAAQGLPLDGRGPWGWDVRLGLEAAICNIPRFASSHQAPDFLPPLHPFP